MKNYLEVIDKYIDDECKDEKYIIELSLLVQHHFQVAEIVESEDFLFKKENEKNIQRFIAFCFLRIIGNANWIYIEPYKHKIFKHIQNSIPEICDIIGVVEKTETYEKEIRFRDFIMECKKDIYEKLIFSGDISDLNGYQQNFRRTINNRKYSVIHSFCDSSLLNKSILDKIFNRISDFVNANEELKYSSYKQFEEVIESYLEDVSKCGTKYSNELILFSFSNIFSLLMKEIEQSPYYLVTEIELSKTEKKYPFMKGSQNAISIEVHNKGKGFAQNVRLKIIQYDKEEIDFKEVQKYIGNLKIESIIVDFEYESMGDSINKEIVIEASWNCSADTLCSHKYEILLEGQTSIVNWEEAKNHKPYNLEPVETNLELIGRDAILQSLKNMVSIPLGSAYVFGQRRVGKTSIVKTLQNTTTINNMLLYYIEAGDWNDAKDAYRSMENLGEKICKKIKRFNPKFSSIPIPEFSGSFNKISDFLDDVIDIDNSFRLLIILDEFDRISNSLYERGDTGRSFVLTIRSISNRPQFGFILVGGEKMEYILSQWQEFNKFSPIRVDYFSRERDWEDFRKLIKKPVEGILEISDDAINCIYEETAGNPYFTKKICMELYANMVQNRDIHVTEKEINIAIEDARSSSNIGATDFSHFWEDGIKGKVEKEEETSLKRRKVLIIIAQTIQSGNILNKNNIIDFGLEMGLTQSEIEKYLLEFEQRKILYTIGNNFHFVVNFFKKWLISGGKEKIIATFEEEARVVLNLQLEENAKIKSDEIIKLLEKDKIYKGHKITTDSIRNWLSQFDDVFDQRIIFKLLQNFKLYNESEIRTKLSEIFSTIRKDLNKKGNIRFLDSSKRKRDDFLVTYLDKSPAKGASYFTKLFADENNIYSDNVCAPELIEKKLIEKPSIKCLIIIDDFIGSGNTMITNVKDYFHDDLNDILKSKTIPVHIAAITGFLSSKEKIEIELASLNLDININIADILNDEDKCFSLQSRIFANPSETRRAREICLQKGEKLEPKLPLGYLNCESLIAFPMNCPNNTLPIFWKKTENWNPLFERN